MNRSAETKSLGRRSSERGGWSLIEVILAIAILAAAVAIIAQILRLGVRAARTADELARAQTLCESKISEITAGLMEPDAMERVSFEEDPDWLYSIALESADTTDLVALRVTVERAESLDSSRAISFSMVRWIFDPGMEFSDSSAADAWEEDEESAESAEPPDDQSPDDQSPDDQSPDDQSPDDSPDGPPDISPDMPDIPDLPPDLPIPPDMRDNLPDNLPPGFDPGRIPRGGNRGGGQGGIRGGGGNGNPGGNRGGGFRGGGRGGR